MSRRIGLLSLAVVIAVIGASAVFAYVSRVEAQAVSGSQPVRVLVAAQRIPAGLTAAAALQRKLVRSASMPKRSVPEGALTSLEGLGTQTLVSDVFAGELLLRPKFADQTARTGALMIPKEKIAISVELGDPQRVAGFVVPGSEVAIFVTVEANTASVRATATTTGRTAVVDATATADGQLTRLLLPRTSVIAVGPSTLRPETEKATKKKSADAVDKAVLTVAVTQDEAERLVHSAQTGELYFGLLSSSSRTGRSTGVSSSNLFTRPGA